MTTPDGKRRCTATSTRSGKPCQAPPIKGGTVCVTHGGRAPQVKAAAARRLEEQKVRAELDRHHIQVQPGQDPYEVLDTTLGQLVGLRDRLGGIVTRLEDDALRYEGRAGEQARAELALYRQVLTDTATVAERISKLGLAERRVRVQEATVVLLAQAVRNTLRDLGVDTHDPQLRPILVRNLRALDAHVAEPAQSFTSAAVPEVSR